ncbi:MAG: hypothetical protein KDB14_13225 [Planctomycetales bacterium]|nr:hypothetical protein [Planctomycetales bacterium]
MPAFPPTSGQYRRGDSLSHANRRRSRRPRPRKRSLRRLAIEAFEQRLLLAGDLDTSFGDNGQLLTPLFTDATTSDQIRAVATSPSGKTYALGTREIVAYNGDGSLDLTFGSQGRVSASVDAYDIVAQVDGKLVVAGRLSFAGTGLDFGVARYLPDGQLDSTFGVGGIASADIGSSGDWARALAVDGDGNYVVAGVAGVRTDATGLDFAMARFLPNGDLDTSLGGTGVIRTDLSAASEQALGVAVDAANGIVLAGVSNTQPALARYHADGSLDTGFDGDGLLTTAIGLSGGYESVAIDADGNVVAAGTSVILGTGNDFAIARYLPDGSLDPAYDGDGIATVAVGSGTAHDLLVAMELESSTGAATLAGRTLTGTLYEFATVRLTSNGSLDATFASGGIARTSIGPANDFPTDMAVDSRGRIVVGGFSNFGSGDDFVLVRYDANGILDSTFDGDGIVTTNIGSSNERSYAVSVQSDGKLVTAGFAYTGSTSQGGSGNDLLLTRQNADGSLDATFGVGGVARIDIMGENNTANAVVAQSDGKLLVAGVTGVSGQGDFLLARLLADGSLDPTFGAGGIVTTDLGTTNDVARSIAVQSDGRIVVAGYTGGPSDAAVARYNSDGSLDSSFGSGGSVLTDLGGEELVFSVAVGNDGSITVGGYHVPAFVAGADYNFLALRYDSNGSPDTSFGGVGYVLTDFGANVRETAFTMALQPDGKTLVAGLTDRDGDADYAVARYAVDGTLDATFGVGGLVSFDFDGSNDGANALAVQPNGSIIVSGTSFLDRSRIGLARLTSDGQLDPSFGTAGRLTYAPTPGGYYTHGMALQGDGAIVVAGYVAGRTEDLLTVRFLGDLNAPATGEPVILGVARENETLQVDTSGIHDANGVGELTYQWMRNGVAVSGATSATFELDDADVGAAISVAVFFDGIGSAEGPLFSAATAPVVNVNDVPTGSPVIVGVVAFGETLGVDTSAIGDEDGLGPFSYQWLRDSSPVSGATASTYDLSSVDVGAQISVVVSYLDGQGTPENLVSSGRPWRVGFIPWTS